MPEEVLEGHFALLLLPEDEAASAKPPPEDFLFEKKFDSSCVEKGLLVGFRV